MYGIGYVAREPVAGHLDSEDGVLFKNEPESIFTGALLLLLAAMTLAILSRHLALQWVAIEATTLASAPLIYYHQNRRSLEAAWKYLMLCSVGIAIALLGIFFLRMTIQDGPHDLTLAALLERAGTLNHKWLSTAFIFMLVGYGTKMGLAPLHTWLPDAHSEAPSPVSALLSGALLNCAFLGILRVQQVCAAAGMASFGGDLLILFGLLSMGLAGAFLLRQADYKRMLAYSSVEHMGILALGVGLGGLGLFGSLLHTVNHSIVKAMLFFTAGNLLSRFHTKDTTKIQGACDALPISGALWIAGFLAVTGSPPFGTFISEFTILRDPRPGPMDRRDALRAVSAAGVRRDGGHRAADGAGQIRGEPGPRAGHGGPAAPRLGRSGAAAGRVSARPAGGPAARGRPTAGRDGEMTTLPQLHNGQALPMKDIPELAVPEFRSLILERVRRGRRISSLFGLPDGDQIMLLAVLAHDSQGMLELCRTRVRDRYPALTPDVPQAHWFEREIAEQWGLVPEGHPWLKPIRFHPSYTPNRDAWSRDKAMPIEPGVTNYFRVEGEEIHEVAVGPVHAGIIEPGHFRFQCHGEDVLHLEIELGYQHRGIERALARRARTQRHDPLHGDTGRRHHDRARHRLCLDPGGTRRHDAFAAGPGDSGDRPGIGATGEPHRRSGRLGRRHRLSCRPPPIAAGCGAIFSISPPCCAAIASAAT